MRYHLLSLAGALLSLGAVAATGPDGERKKIRTDDVSSEVFGTRGGDSMKNKILVEKTNDEVEDDYWERFLQQQGSVPGAASDMPTTAMPSTAMPTTAIPTAMPTTSMPTALPTTTMPTALPTTTMPTVLPTISAKPTVSSQPTPIPTMEPTADPTQQPTLPPTPKPTTATPTPLPTPNPTHSPTFPPTPGPTHTPTFEPTTQPTQSAKPTTGTDLPTVAPTTSSPTQGPTETPTETPTLGPTLLPTFQPSPMPTRTPTEAPTTSPSHGPTQGPTPEETVAPTIRETTERQSLAWVRQMQPATRGNEAKVSPDGEAVYVTSSLGFLYAFDAETGSPIFQYGPAEPSSSISGVSFSPDGSQLVYAVRSVLSGNSRVLAFDRTGTSPVWISEELEGFIPGTPQMGTGGTHVYFTRNTQNDAIFTVLEIIGNTPSIYYTKSLSELEDEGAIIPENAVSRQWGPVGIAHTPSLGGNYAGGSSNFNDFVSFAHLANLATSEDANDDYGYYYGFQLPGREIDLPELLVFGDVTWGTATRPIFSADGQKMFYGGSRQQIRGWVDKRFQSGADVRISPLRTGSNPSLSTFSISPDETKIFFATARTRFYAGNASPNPPEGEIEDRILWQSVSLQDVVEVGSHVSPFGDRVYFITRNGRVHSADTEDGDIKWRFDTSQAVTADFSISADGSALYFVTQSGQLWKLNLPR